MYYKLIILLIFVNLNVVLAKDQTSGVYIPDIETRLPSEITYENMLQDGLFTGQSNGFDATPSNGTDPGGDPGGNPLPVTDSSIIFLFAGIYAFMVFLSKKRYRYNKNQNQAEE